MKDSLKSALLFLKTLPVVCLLIFNLAACTENNSDPSSVSQGERAVYVLVDTSGTYSKQFDQVQLVLRRMLRLLQSGESLALARIDSISFSEKDIIARMTFDARPYMANAQKRAFVEVIDNFSKDIRVKKHTDITGGVLQAIEYLNETGSENKYILIFSDLKEEVREDHVHDFPINFSGTNVLAINLSELQKDGSMPKKIEKRLEYWQGRVENGAGLWKVINDPSLLDSLLQ